MRSGSSWYCVVAGRTLSWEDVTGRKHTSTIAARQREKRSKEKADERQAISDRDLRFASMLAMDSVLFRTELSQIVDLRFPATPSDVAAKCGVSTQQALALLRKHELVVSGDTSPGTTESTADADVDNIRCSKCRRRWRNVTFGNGLHPLCRVPGCSGDPVHLDR